MLDFPPPYSTCTNGIGHSFFLSLLYMCSWCLLVTCMFFMVDNLLYLCVHNLATSRSVHLTNPLFTVGSVNISLHVPPFPARWVGQRGRCLSSTIKRPVLPTCCWTSSGNSTARSCPMANWMTHRRLWMIGTSVLLQL